jgi:phosphoserine phosphatase RsbU/P
MSDALLEMDGEYGKRDQVRITKDVWTLGRRTGNDLRLVEPDISRDHAELARDGERWVLRDRGSRFGTYLNNVRVEKEQVLRHGDLIRLGQTGGKELVFLYESGSGLRSRSSDPITGPVSGAGSELRQVATLLEGLRALGSSRVLDDVLALVIDSAIELSGAERGFIMMADAEGRLEFKLARSRGRVTLPGTSFETSRKIPEEVFTVGETRVVLDIMDADHVAAHGATAVIGIRSVFCVPLRLVRYVDKADGPPEERRVGVLYLDSKDRGTLSSANVRAGLETLATEAAVALENARLYREAVEKAKMEQELRIAAEIQQSLLPPPAWSADHFEAVGRTVPCRAIGGDFYEYFTMADGAAGFVVADVSGKGAPAALLTAVTQGVLATQTAVGGGPAAALARVNEILIRRAIGSRFVTVFFAALGNDGLLTCCNGGHNPPFLISGSSVRRLETGGLICGLFEKAVYEEERVQLQPGDILVMFSDGISEALSQAGEEFGDDRILGSVRKVAQASANDILEELVRTVREFAAGTVQSDDMTAVVMRYRPNA